MKSDINWFESRVSLTPNEIAIIDSHTNDSWTYAALHRRVAEVANYFHSKGIRKGDRVAILAPNHISYFDFFFAVMKIGAIFIPLNWRLAEAELEYVIKDCDPKIIGIDPLFADKIKSMDGNPELILIEHNDYLNELITEKQFTIKPQLKEEDPLAMIYTGGTTGRPKGVVLSHRSILWNALNTTISWDLTQNDTTLTCLPMFHTGGLNVYSLPLLLVGGRVVISSEFDPERAVEDLITYKCTVVLFVPTMYHMIIQTDIFKRSSFPDMKVFVSGGAPCPLKIYHAFSEKGLAFKEGYGLTEAGPNNFYIDTEDTLRKLGSVGKPMIFNDIKIIGEDGLMTEPDEVGELLIRGNHAFEYYWNKPEDTKETIKGGWIHTGDLARRDKDGFFYIVGRKKDMIITGGENVYPLEVEHWLESHEAVGEAAVVGLPDDKWGEVVVAFVVTKRDITPKALEMYCDQKIARYKVPKKFYFLDELPKTHVGKINKAALKENIRYTNDSTVS
ncbi:class I adenylate-forming enzyme family protein [Oceanobacillus damuensis]|uniref:class I adenylate-forming enzyme family protein n=1 Tax=Oceanobacillus damuensis TaxID=937928 RepID=UPI00082E313A|nr:long-chain fatty acid--CoA ligase [Oceanobacillus damuensis]